VTRPPRIPPARSAALSAVSDCLRRDMDLQAALDKAIIKRGLLPRDASMTSELCYGYIRLRARIDFVLDSFLKNPKGLPANIRLVLGLAAYEILHLDRVPGYASVDWAVEAAKRSGKGLAGLVNAVLRKVSDLGERALEPGFFRRDNPGEALFLSRYYSMPQWIVDAWIEAYGRENARNYLKASARPAPTGLRINASRPEAAEIYDELKSGEPPVERLDHGLAYEPGACPDVVEYQALGLVSRQSLAAQQVMIELGCDAWPAPIWDACAGRGGKTCMLVERGRGPVWASDLNFARLRGLRSELSRLGLPELPVFQARADTPFVLAKRPETVLLDLPCTGLGVLSRRPDIKWKRTPQDVRRLAELQARIITAAYGRLRRGGCVAVITCTLMPEENDKVLDGFLKDHSDAEVEKAWQTASDSDLREFFWGVLIRKA